MPLYGNNFLIKSNQIFRYTRCAGAHFRVIAPAGNRAPFKEMSQQWRAVGNTVRFDRPYGFEPLTSRSSDERDVARLTDRCT